METWIIDTPDDHALEGQTQAAQSILATAARVGRVHPRNDRMRYTARNLVLSDLCALAARQSYADAGEDCDRRYSGWRMEELSDNQQSAKDDIAGLEDNDLTLVLQGLLELHLRMAVQWVNEHLDPAILVAAAFPRSNAVDLIDRPLTLSDVLAYELVAAWHAACFEPGSCQALGSKDGSLRRIVRAADRSIQLAVVMAVADAATSVAIARDRQQPWGKFHFLEEGPA